MHNFHHIIAGRDPNQSEKREPEAKRNIRLLRQQIILVFLKTQTDSKKRLLRQKNIFEQMEKPKVTLIYNGVKREILRRTMM